MGLGERLRRLVPDRIKPAIKPTTYEDFMDQLRNLNASRVVAVPSRKKLFATGNSYGEDGAHWEYNITFNGTGQRGRRIDYYHTCIQKFLDEPDYINAHGVRMHRGGFLEDLERTYGNGRYQTSGN